MGMRTVTTLTFVLVILMACTSALAAERTTLPAGPGGEPDALSPNDQCDGAIALCGAFTITTNTSDETNDYDPGASGCTGYAASGPDETYKICLPPGGSIDLTFNEVDYDGSIYLVTDCADVAATCVAGDDCYPYPCFDYITHTNTNAVPIDYWLIVDGYGGASGTGVLEGMTDCCGATPVEESTWGQIKSLNR